MNDNAPQPRPMTHRQLRAVVYKIALTYLEVERGLRPPAQLAACLSPAEYRRHRVIVRGPRADARPVRPPDIGRVRIDAATPERVNASVLVRRDKDAWSALVVDIKQTGRGWQVDRLDRLERLLPREPRQVEVSENSLDRRIRLVEDERRTVAAVHDAVKRRYDRIEDKRTRGARDLGPERERWAARAEELDAERSRLARTRRLRERHEVSTLREEFRVGHGGGEAGASILGPRPEDPSRAQIWDHVQEGIAAYRDRWDIEADEPLLHPAPNEEQAAELQELVHRLRHAVKNLTPTSSPTRDDVVVDSPHSLLGVDL